MLKTRKKTLRSNSEVPGLSHRAERLASSATGSAFFLFGVFLISLAYSFFVFIFFTFSPLGKPIMSTTQDRIDQLVKDNEVLLFMKGTASFPQCGFSGRAIQILKACGVDTKSVKTVNVLEDPEIRQGIKEYSQWPTIPQLYVKGEFVGGSDIMMEMYESGELQQVIGKQSD
jgi:monothiol glutaredoxin